MQRAAPSRHLSSALSSWPQMRVDSDLPDHAHQPVARIEQSDMRASWFEARSGANPASSGPISSASANHSEDPGDCAIGTINHADTPIADGYSNRAVTLRDGSLPYGRE